MPAARVGATGVVEPCVPEMTMDVSADPVTVSNVLPVTVVPGTVAVIVALPADTPVANPVRLMLA